jgi:hypothetical protein
MGPILHLVRETLPTRAPAGLIGHMSTPNERQQVVHAQRVKRDITSEHELVAPIVVGKCR